MAAITWSDVTDLAPELSTTNSTVQGIVLDIANGRGVNVSVFGGEDSSMTKWARMNLAAHLGTAANPTGGVTGLGSVKMEEVGDVRREYAAISFAESDYNLTKYGIAFRELARSTCARFGVI